MSGLKLKGCDAKRAEVLAQELGKVRCWLTGFEAGRGRPNMIPGEDSLRQLQVILKDSVAKANPTPTTDEAEG